MKKETFSSVELQDLYTIISIILDEGTLSNTQILDANHLREKAHRMLYEQTSN